MFGHTVLMDGLCESWPRRGVLILGVAGEELMITFGAGINPWFKVVFEDLSAIEDTKRHGAGSYLANISYVLDRNTPSGLQIGRAHV